MMWDSHEMTRVHFLPNSFSFIAWELRMMSSKKDAMSGEDQSPSR